MFSITLSHCFYRTAAFSDNKKGKGRGKNKEHAGEGQEGTATAEQDPEASGAAISSILQKALLKRVQKLQQESQQST